MNGKCIQELGWMADFQYSNHPNWHAMLHFSTFQKPDCPAMGENDDFCT